MGKRRGKSPRHGMALGVALVMMVVLFVLATGAATLGTSNLNLALSQLNSEKTYQIAEAGLTYAYGDLAMGNLNAPGGAGLLPTKTYTLGQSVNHDEALVKIFDNRSGLHPVQAGCPTTIATGYIYLVSEGHLMNNSHVVLEEKVGAMVCLGGGGAMSFGVNCANLNVRQGILSTFDANHYLELGGYTVAATNMSTAGAIQLGASSPVTVKGNVLVPAGASGTSVMQGSYSFAAGDNVQNLASPLNFPRVTIPSLPTKASQNFPKTTATSALIGPFTPLPEGHYDTVNVTGPGMLKGRYIIDNLAIQGGGQLDIQSGAVTSLYVTNLDLSAAPSGPFFSNTASSNRFKLYYEGTNPLSLDLNDHSNVCLVAPHANVVVHATDLSLGAVAAANLTIQMANPGDRFCYDPTAAQPAMLGSGGASSVSNGLSNGGQGQQQQQQQMLAPGSNKDAVIPGYQACVVVGRQRF